MEVKLYIEGKLVDLFPKGEQNLQYQSKLASITKLSSVFTDISQDFSVPCTPNNDEIFKYYWNIDFANRFNAGIRVDAYIEIDTLPFRYGKVQLNKVNGKYYPDSYQITFYGALTQLSELFGDDTIDRLDYEIIDTASGETEVKSWSTLSQYDYEYDDINFVASIGTPGFQQDQVITPLIAWTDRDWEYGSNNIYDISQSANAIKDTELKPALRIFNIIKGIETKYGVSFSRQFFGSSVFNNLFMWLNGSTTDVANQEFLVDINTTFSGSNDGSFTSVGDTVSITRRLYSDFTAVKYIAKISCRITPLAGYTGVLYDVIAVNDSGVTIAEFKDKTGTFTANVSWTSSFKFNTDTTLTTNNVRFFVKPKSTLLYNANIYVDYYRNAASVITTYVDVESINNSQTNNISITMEQNLPKMKVIDFFQSLMLQFKLMVRPLSTNSFEINTWDGWYAEGAFRDYTDYVEIGNYTIEVPKIYKEIKFKYEKSNLVLGKQFREELRDPTNKEIGYGDLQTVYRSIDTTKDDLSVEVKFENMLFERLPNVNATGSTETNISIGQSMSLSEDGTTLSKATPKPILFFYNGLANITESPVWVKFSSNNAVQMVRIPIIGNTNDAILSQVTNSINFGSEIDPWHQVSIPNSLFKLYWENWIKTIYDLRQRRWSYTAVLPPYEAQRLALNDRIIIGDKRFKIEDFTINLVNGDTKLNLFTDIFEYGSTPAVINTNSISANAGTKYYSAFLNTNQSWTVTKTNTGSGTGWITLLTPSGTGSSEVPFIIQGNASTARSMDLTLNVGGASYVITVAQDGLPST